MGTIKFGAMLAWWSLIWIIMGLTIVGLGGIALGGLLVAAGVTAEWATKGMIPASEKQARLASWLDNELADPNSYHGDGAELEKWSRRNINGLPNGFILADARRNYLTNKLSLEDFLEKMEYALKEPQSPPKRESFCDRNGHNYDGGVCGCGAVDEEYLFMRRARENIKRKEETYHRARAMYVLESDPYPELDYYSSRHYFDRFP